tara:strand:- start:16556 stop:16993 length:438 start_codon:yes stop_codon:yes gene_type:complete
MRYEVLVDIDLPIDEVVEKFRNTENYYDWMKGLEKIEHVKGEPGEKGAENYLYFNTGKRKMKMLEKVLRSDLPKSYLVSYEVNGVYNEVDNHFEKIDETTTRYTTDNLFEFKGIMKLMAFFMKSAFKKQSLKYLNDFKKFVEQQD